MKTADFIAELSDLEHRFNELSPELEVTVRDNDLGIEGYVVVWSSAPGRDGPLGACGKGGTRITPDVTLAQVKMLAQQMALKNAACGLPLGGAKSGLRADPAAADFERKYRRFVRMVSPLLLENGGTFGGFGFDIGGRPEHALWACDELGSTRCFTGKALEHGGTDYDREGIAGLGVAVAAREVLRFFGSSPNECTFSVQGAGAMGSAVLRYFTAEGATPQYISDVKLGGTVQLEPGRSSELLAALERSELSEARRIIEAQRISLLPLDAVLYEEADVLFPCALQDVITESNVDRVRARYVVEGANNPCSPEAQSRLFERGIVAIPGYMANSGGIIAAYVEMTSTLSPEENLRTRGNVHKAKALAEEKVAANVHSLLSLAADADVEPALAARYLALSRVLKSDQRSQRR